MNGLHTVTPPTDHQETLQRYHRVRQFSDTLCETLEAEDCCIQSMPDASPTRWHLAHTTWFFATFVLDEFECDYRGNDKYKFLFNSYYNAVGKQYPRAKRGLLSRPTVGQVMGYRREIDERIARLLTQGDDYPDELFARIELGLNHEQQHQELMLTDIKHAFSCNPLWPQYRPGSFDSRGGPKTDDWVSFDGGIFRIGHEGSEFAYDNELPAHRVLLDSFLLESRLVTVGDYLRFMQDGGYEKPELWLSEGWLHVVEEQWQAPLYWIERDGNWQEFTLTGLTPLDLNRPVCHVSFFEADAYARWAGARLPTEAEWEVASRDLSVEGNFADGLITSGSAVHPRPAARETEGLLQMFGDVWEWTASPYVGYPGYKPATGALGEYNGKFMCNQFVLRGGSCATPTGHIRRTYRNFFPPAARWQFSGLRLAK